MGKGLSPSFKAHETDIDTLVSEVVDSSYSLPTQDFLEPIGTAALSSLLKDQRIANELRMKHQYTKTMRFLETLYN
jgi:hypothetical protein